MPTSPYLLQPPDTLKLHDRITSIGATVYRALAILAARCRVKIADLCNEVWGSVRSKWAVKALVQRINEKLAAVGCRVRCGVDGADVVLT